MQIGAIGGMSYTPYIYNTNTVSSASLNKVSGISDDLLESKTDFSALSGETTNPIKKGQSLDFAGIIDMQMQMSRLNASRVMKEPEKAEEVTQAAGVSSASEATDVQSAVAAGQVTGTADIQAASVVSGAQDTQQAGTAFDYAKAMAAYQPMDLYA